MPWYSAYGLTIDAAFAIPELMAIAPPPAAADITIGFGDVPVPGGSFPEGTGRADGARIDVHPLPDVDERVWRLSLFGPVLGLALIQRGLLVLHGGAVAGPHGAVVVLGPGGSGKSTLTGELCRQGGALLTDDAVALDLSADVPLVVPGIPLLKLWPDAVDEAPDGAWTRTLHPDFVKVGRRLDDALMATPTPVAGIFLLAGGPELTLEPLAGTEAFRAMMASLFAARYGDGFVAGLDGRDLLDKLTRLMAHVPVTALRAPQDRTLLARTATMLLAWGDHGN